MTAFSIKEFFAQVFSLSAKLRQPSPAFPVLNILNGGPRNAEHDCQFLLADAAMQLPDFQNVGFSESCKVVSLSPVAGFMFNPVHLIIGRRFPREVRAAHTSKMTLAARMSRMVFAGRRGAVDRFAHPTRHDMGLPVNASAWVPATGIGKGPDEAIGAKVIGRNISYECEGVTLWRPPAGWTAVANETDVMFSAKSFSAASCLIGKVVARFNRTCFGFVSHLDLSKGWAWLEPAKTLQRLAGSRSIPAKVCG